MTNTHYQFGGSHCEKTGVYEWYAETSKKMKDVQPAEAAAASAVSQVYGTPAQCADKINKIRKLLDPEHMSLCFGLPGMTYDCSICALDEAQSFYLIRALVRVDGDWSESEATPFRKRFY